MEIVDLDILKPEPVNIRFCGSEIDISFIPCEIALKAVQENERMINKTHELTALQQENNKAKKKTQEMTEAENVLSFEIFDSATETCAMILSLHDEKFTKDFLSKNATLLQMQNLTTLVIDAISDSVKTHGVSNSKNLMLK